MNTATPSSTRLAHKGTREVTDMGHIEDQKKGKWAARFGGKDTTKKKATKKATKKKVSE